MSLTDEARRGDEGRMKIGLLEDNPALLDFMSTMLEMAGHSVETHTSGSSLLETLFLETKVRFPLPYDIIIVDLLLPGSMSGLETIQTIRQRLSPTQLPVLIVTAVGSGELAEAITRLPEVPVLRKPFQRSALLQLIEELKGSENKDRLSQNPLT
jgi:CheY-like chemotaxis protein